MSGVFEDPRSSHRFNMIDVFEEPPRCNYDAFVISSLRSSLVYNVLDAKTESDTSKERERYIRGLRPLASHLQHPREVVLQVTPPIIRDDLLPLCRAEKVPQVRFQSSAEDLQSG